MDFHEKDYDRIIGVISKEGEKVMVSIKQVIMHMHVSDRVNSTKVGHQSDGIRVDEKQKRIFNIKSHRVQVCRRVWKRGGVIQQALYTVCWRCRRIGFAKMLD